MGYQNNNQEKSGYDKSKDLIIGKFGTKVGNRYLNCIVYSYDGGDTKIRISPTSENTNPNCKPNEKWINGKSISGITVDEAKALLINLQKAINEV